MKVRRISGKVTNYLRDAGMTSDWLPGLPRILVHGMKWISIDNCLGAVEIGNEKIRIGSKLGVIVVLGNDLLITSMRNNRLVITGEILNIALEGRR